MSSQLQDAIVGHLSLIRFNYRGESDLQEGVAAVLEQAGLDVRREVRLDARDRIDLLVDDVGVEVKIAGTATNVLKQLGRYAAHPEIGSLVLVSSLSRHACINGAEFDGATVRAVITSRCSF